MFNICSGITENLSAVTFSVCSLFFFYPLQQTVSGKSYSTRKMLKAIANGKKIPYLTQITLPFMKIKAG